MQLKDKKILITGASFIGAHLIDKLIEKQVRSIRVANLTERHKDNLAGHIEDIEFCRRDLRNLENAKKSLKGIDIVFHLAADHGGRGYVDLFQGRTASNFLLDGSIFLASLEEGVEKVFFASSGCVYPNHLQTDTKKKLLLKEGMVISPYDADNMYGWAKLMGELTLKAYYKDFGLRSAIGRFFTVYGEGASESHAVIGSIAKNFIEQNPYEIWGDGQQIRNWTYVEDIVNGILLMTEKIEDATSINLGTTERIKVLDMVNLVFKYGKHYPHTLSFKDMPTGPQNRVADISLAKDLLGWSPKYSFGKGLKKTIDWYFSTKNSSYIKKNLERLLLGI